MRLRESQHFHGTWIWSIYPSIDKIFHSLWFLFLWIPWYLGLQLTRKLLNQSFLSGQIEDITWFKHILLMNYTLHFFFTIQYNIGFRNKRNDYINTFPKTKSSLRMCYGSNHDLVNRYGMSVSQMTTYMFVVIPLSSLPHSLHIMGLVTRITWVHPVEQELCLVVL